MLILPQPASASIPAISETASGSNGRPLPIAVLISGGGTTLRNLLERMRAGELPVTVRLVVSSSAKARGLEFAAAAGIPTRVLPRSAFASDEDYGAAVFEACRESGVSLVVMGGFLKFVPIPADFTHRVVNIHPSLIPAFCGAGMYGHHVHEAVLAHGAKVSGCTVHFVDNQYDHGPIILQRAVPVLDDDTPATLAERVFAAECAAYPEAIRSIAEGRVRVQGRRVLIAS
jgi:formyltetrahydrofolate-dependent phosphoribosylglycinamide formyltransferase